MIVLDTHAWLWWETGSRELSRRAARAIERADTIGISSVSVYELVQIVVRRRIELRKPLRQWIGEALARERVESIGLTPSLAIDAAQLPFVGDPFDRIIYATARTASARLATRDERLHAFDPKLALW